MVTSIVLDVVDFLRPAASGDLFEKVQIGVCIEDGIAMVQKTCRENIHASEDFHAFTRAAHRHVRLVSTACPRAIERRVLSETRFIRVDQGRPLPPGFFLYVGTSVYASDPVSEDPPAQEAVSVAG